MGLSSAMAEGEGRGASLPPKTLQNHLHTSQLCVLSAEVPDFRVSRTQYIQRHPNT
jgi:hypothetical protein